MTKVINSADYFGNKLKALLHNNAKSIIGGITDEMVNGVVLVDNKFTQQLTNALLAMDISLSTITKILFPIRKHHTKKEISLRDIKRIVYNEIKQILMPYSHPIDIDYNLRPQVIVICGINGAGKTTTVSKMAHMLSRYSWRVTIAACDTTRKSASDHLRICSSLPNVTVIAAVNQDEKPTAIARRAMATAEENMSDIILVDTPGFTAANEIAITDTKMVIDAIEGIRGDAPHNVVLVLDATNGNNAKSQISIFRSIAAINGIVVTKLDVAKHAGILLSAADELKIPVHGIGLGCEPEDLQDFSAEEFAEGLSGILL